MNTQALVVVEPNRVELQPVEVPEPGPGEVLIETAYSCISPGTELRALGGRQPDMSFPYIPGYSMTGTVVAAWAGTSLAAGTRVYSSGTAAASVKTMWGGHCAHVVRAENAVIPLPENVESLDASITHLAAIAYHGLRLNMPQPHEQIAVIGLGAIGQLSARLHTLSGAHTVAADLAPGRVQLAQEAGVQAFVPTGLTDFRRYFPQGADSVVDATGYPAVMREAIHQVRDRPWDDIPTPAGRYVIQGSYPGDFALDYHDAFHKEAVFLVPRDAQPRDFRTVIDLMQRGLLDVRNLIGAVVDPADAQRIYDTLQTRTGDIITAAFKWG